MSLWSDVQRLSVLTSIFIYYITMLDVLMEVLMKIDSIRREFLSTAFDKVTCVQCNVHWDIVCKLKEFKGLGILNLTKFALALRMRWLWNEWNEDPKPWVGLGNPCQPHDYDHFAAATKVIIGNGNKSLFGKHLG
jgi:hypothetical protein